ncbi:uncharacterized protein LOC131210974 [Anopheles bellator]|uniref:uncharacterized protein LOC131210974 n=1 Tax=Anopheles bellator TaxID=139047 RepID=UPI00264A26B6|nr:uncharacterized protein LOC131210974 [Anopheles bellator]
MLFESVQCGDLDKVRHLLDGGADINARDDKFFNTALHRSVFARRHRAELIELLVARGADCNALNKKRLTASELALENNLEEVAKHLIRCETEHLDDHLAYYLLIRRGNLQLFEYLISLKRLRYEDEILIIAKAYGELRLKNVPLNEPMESYLNEILINHDYWLRNDAAEAAGPAGQGKRKRQDARGQTVRRRLEAIVSDVQELCGSYDSHNLMDVDSLFLLRLSHILENIFFVRNHYKQLPLHHMEFCIAIFLHIWKDPPRYDIYKMLVDKRKLMLYLGAIANELQKILARHAPATPSRDPPAGQCSVPSDADTESRLEQSSASHPSPCSKVRPRKFQWTSERNRELMFCHYVVMGSNVVPENSSNYRARLHELWTERQRARDTDDPNRVAVELSVQNLLTQQRKIVRDHLLPEEVRRQVEAEAISYRCYVLRTNQPKVSDRNRKLFRKMAKSYRRMRELHAINRALGYIGSVTDFDWSNDREIKTIAMKRVVQVICETLRHGRDTPVLAKHMESFVNVLTPQRILADARIRDVLSHYRRGTDLLPLLAGGNVSSAQERQDVHLSDDLLDYEELHRNLRILHNLFRYAQNLQHVLAIKTLINRLYDSKSLEEIKSYYAYLFRHNSPTGDCHRQDLDVAPFALLEINALLDAIAEEYRSSDLPVSERFSTLRSRVLKEIDSYRVLHQQLSNTLLMVDCLLSKIKSNHSYEKIRHTFRSHLRVLQRNRNVDREFLVQLRNTLLVYLYDELPALRHRSALELRLALLVARVLYVLDRSLARSPPADDLRLTVQLTSSGSSLLKRLEGATGRQLPFLVNDALFRKVRDNPDRRFELLRQLLRRHRILHKPNLLADLRREEERETEEKVAQLQKLFLDQNMNMRAFDRTDEIAFEMLMLEATTALSGRLADNRESLCNYVPVLTGRNLRNYLAHGHPTYEVLIPNTGPKTILLNALSVIKLSKNIISEIYDRHCWSFADRVAVVRHQHEVMEGFRYQSCGEIRDTIRKEAHLLGQSHLGHGIVDQLVQHQSCMLLGHLLDFGRVDEFLKPLSHLMESSVRVIPCGRPLHTILADRRARTEFCYHLAVLSNDEDILSKIVADFGYEQIDSIPLVFNFDRLFASFLETHPDYDVNAESNTEILHYAVQSGNVEMLNLLLDQCHDLNQRDVYGQTPLEVACKLANIEMVKALTNAGAKWYTNGEYGCAQYAWIFLNNDQEAIVFLKNNDLLSAKIASACLDLFLQYCDDTNEEIVEFMLANNAAEYGRLYTKAATFRRVRALQFMLETDRKLKGNVNRKDGSVGLTPLQIAARRGYADIVELLLRHGANVQARDTSGHSVLHFAVESKSVPIVRILLRHGAQVGVPDTHGVSPLEVAIEAEHRKLTRLLLRSGQPIGKISLPEVLRNQRLVADLLKVKDGFERCCRVPADGFGDSFTPLHHATDERTIERLQRLYGIDVASPRYGTTPLHLASLCNDHRRVKALLRHGANPTLANSEGMTPLVLAVCNRNVAIVRTLLNHITDRGADEDLDEVLAIAVRKSALDIANLLLLKGAGIEVIGRTLAALSPTKSQHQPQTHQLIFCAAREGYNRILEYLLGAELDVDVNSKDTIHSVPLFHALARAPLETLDILLRHGANVEHCNKFGHNVLSIATMNCRVDLLRYFVNNFPPVVRFLLAEESDTKNRVLHLAVLRGALDIVQYCVGLHREHGYTLDARNKEGFTALHISAQTGDEAIFGYLLSHGANPTVSSANGQSILHTAICNRNLNIVRAIVTGGVLPLDRDLVDRDGRSPLHYAVFSRNACVVREVLKFPALPLNHADVRGNTALHTAAEFQYVELYNLLQKRIDNELRNANGKRAIDILLRK